LGWFTGNLRGRYNTAAINDRLNSFSTLLPLNFLSNVKLLCQRYADLSDDQLYDVALNLGFEARQVEKVAPLVGRGFALVKTMAGRKLNMSHYDVQLMGGKAMCNGHVAEMRTGEGKTLTATLPMFVHSLAGRGALLATSNDYLAKRDAELMQPVYQALGKTVGVVQTEMSREQRRASYQCDITYGTMKEFGFDFLRDHSATREQKQQSLYFGDSSSHEVAGQFTVHRKPNFILIDEADSILIDDARTPLILSAAQDGSTQDQQKSLYQWSANAASEFVEDEDYWYDRERRKTDLTPEGMALVRKINKPQELAGVGLLEMYDFVERAIQVYRDYKMDKDYVIRDGEIVIVDESTGRISEGRRWSRGIHQAIEAKEGVAITMDTATQAKITVQSFVSRFPFLSGMTGTAHSSRREFKKIYHMPVTVIPTNRPSRRKEMPIKYLPDEATKLKCIVEDVKAVHQQGRPILIGTRSIAKSVELSVALTSAGIDHEVLNARQVEREADIVARAGEQGRVTVATNMAGRGTDIKISDAVKSLGGLHVIGTEMHESSRIDQQLFGRCGRQGDPGTVQQYICADDKLLESAFGQQTAMRHRKWANSRSTAHWIRLFQRAQAKVENQHYRSRKSLMYSEKQLAKSQREMGLDPILDNYE
jgi:preprotein translocase subunit SecA